MEYNYLHTDSHKEYLYIISKNMELYQSRIKGDTPAVPKDSFKKLTSIPYTLNTTRLELPSISSLNVNLDGYDHILTLSNGIDNSLFIISVDNSKPESPSTKLLHHGNIEAIKPFKLLDTFYDESNRRFLVALRYIDETIETIDNLSHDRLLFTPATDNDMSIDSDDVSVTESEQPESLKYSKPKMTKATKYVLHIQCYNLDSENNFVLADNRYTLYGDKEIKQFSFAKSSESFLILSNCLFKTDIDSTVENTADPLNSESMKLDDDDDMDDIDPELLQRAREQLKSYNPENMKDGMSHWTPVVTSEENDTLRVMQFDSDYDSVTLYHLETLKPTSIQQLRPNKVTFSEVVSNGNLRVGVSGHVDCHIFEFGLTEGNELSVSHVNTMDAFGFIEESKVRKRFVTVDEAVQWAIICEHDDIIYLYKKRNEKALKSEHQLLEERGTSCLGVKHINNDRFLVLTSNQGLSLMEIELQRT